MAETKEKAVKEKVVSPLLTLTAEELGDIVKQAVSQAKGEILAELNEKVPGFVDQLKNGQTQIKRKPYMQKSWPLPKYSENQHVLISTESDHAVGLVQSGRGGLAPIEGVVKSMPQYNENLDYWKYSVVINGEQKAIKCKEHELSLPLQLNLTAI